MAAALLLLLALPLQALAVELTIRNEDESMARVALTYKQGDRFHVEGWFWLAPGQIEVITMHGVADDDVYIHVEFVDSGVRQFIHGVLEVELLVQDTHFRYVLQKMSEPWTLKSPTMRGVPFQNIPEFYRTEKGKLWFNLGAAAG
jgi:hypothetical protein